MPIPATPPGSSLDATPVTAGNQVVEIAEVSRDGRCVAFDADRAGNQDIYKQPIDGGPVTQLTADPGDDFGPTWSPDGSEIAFYSYRNGVPRQLMVVPADGGPQTRIAEGELSGPEWSADGTMIAVRRRPDDALVLVRRRDGGWSGRHHAVAVASCRAGENHRGRVTYGLIMEQNGEHEQRDQDNHHSCGGAAEYRLGPAARSPED